MYKAVAIFGLAGLAVASPPAYGETSSAPAAYTSSAPAVYSSAAPSSAAAIPSSSAPAVYGSSSSASPVVYGSSSSAPAVYASSSASAVVYASSSSSAPLPSSTCDCWSTCFESAGVTSEADLCGNTAVNQCIYYTCSPSEDQAYWAWYDSYCPVPSTVASSTSSATWSTVTYATPSASATGDCWSACFASNDVTSEADLCGNDAVSACIFNTCSSDLDKAYWEWYDSYCSATTGTSTCTEVVTPTSPATWTETTPYTATPYTTTYETTTWGPVTSAVTTGVPTAPATWTPATSPVPAPYTAPIWSSPYSYSGVPTAATGTGSWATATPTGYPVVPATGAGVVNKPAGLIAMALAAAAFL